MTDIVERLREDAKNNITDPVGCISSSALLQEAADEIERLRERLAKMTGIAPRHFTGQSFSEIKKDIRSLSSSNSTSVAQMGFLSGYNKALKEQKDG